MLYFLIWFCIFRKYWDGDTNSSNKSNNIFPDEISLFILNGSSNLSVDIIPDKDIINIDDNNNCLPIQIILNWNKNGEYNISEYIPECRFDEALSSQQISVNGECFVIEYDNKSVKCGCNEFGTYSTQIVGVNDDNGFFINYITTTFVSILWIFVLIPTCLCQSRCNRFDDEPLIAKQVYMQPLSILYFIWLYLYLLMSFL